jgi:hypothetical protein
MAIDGSMPSRLTPTGTPATDSALASVSTSLAVMPPWLMSITASAPAPIATDTLSRTCVPSMQ